MKFEIEDAVVGTEEIEVTILKDGLFSRNVVVSKKRFQDYVLNHNHVPQNSRLFWKWFYQSCFFFQDLYDYIEVNNLIPNDIIKFEN